MNASRATRSNDMLCARPPRKNYASSLNTTSHTMPSTDCFLHLFLLLLHSKSCSTVRSGLVTNHPHPGQEEDRTEAVGPDMAGLNTSWERGKKTWQHKSKKTHIIDVDGPCGFLWNCSHVLPLLALLSLLSFVWASLRLTIPGLLSQLGKKASAGLRDHWGCLP